jgi:hypothetical protein
MFYSAEARWFFRGDLDARVEAWITSGGLAADQGERTDQYIVLPGCHFAGVKFREGNFEVKAATSPSRDFSLGNTVAGSRETWVKWSRPSSDTGAMRDDEQWAFVRKRRKLRLFSLESTTVEERPYAGPWLSAGCQVERTLVTAMLRSAPDGPPTARDWRGIETGWTLGFEAFGDPDKIDGHLDRMLEYFVADAADVRLPREASMAYPAWLATLAAGT